MFKPKYNITSKLLANIKRIAELTAELNSRRFPKVVLARLERSAREISSYSSTSIEGNPLPLTEVKNILKNRPSNIRDSEREVLNYNQALEQLNRQLGKSTHSFNLKLILQIQKVITKDLIANYRCGKLRKEPVFVNDPRSRKTIYWPPDHQDVPSLLKELIEYITQNVKAIDPLILAGIFHKQFVIIHPFIDGNGRTARLATKSLLAAMGLDTFNLFSFENYYNNNVSKYFQKVGILGNYYAIKDKVDFTPWLEYFTDGIIDELLRVGKELQASVRGPESQLKPYHHKILDYINKQGYITDREYAGITDRAKPTRNLDFKKLIHLGLIEKQGKGKATYYRLKELEKRLG
jgi:Fic family protein